MEGRVRRVIISNDLHTLNNQNKSHILINCHRKNTVRKKLGKSYFKFTKQIVDT